MSGAVRRRRPVCGRRPGRGVLAGALLPLVLLGGCVYGPPPPPLPPPLPAPMVEVVPPPPSAVAVWRRGHWRWNGFRYVWVPGRYVVVRG